MNENQTLPRKPRCFIVTLREKTLGINPGRYNVTESRKGYRLWINKTTWVGLPRMIVERNRYIFRPKRSNTNHKSY